MRRIVMPFHPWSLLRLGVNRIRVAAGADPLDENVGAQDALKQAGQIIVIFALMLTVIIGLVGIAIDTTYAWRESLRVQRAADAASLAGVVYMPGCFDASSPGCGTNNASAIAVAEAKQNGYTASTTTFVTPAKGATPRELDVSITTQSPTFFSRIFGINSWTVTRSSKAVYVTPVPMGSPQAYYGVYALCDAVNTVPNCPNETGPTSVTVTSQGFFGAIEAEGSNTSTGDAFAPYYDGNPTLNPKYNSAGYEYDVTANSAGNLYLFDADFCATSDKKDGSGHAGAGDHWLGANPVGASTYYLLYDTNNTPLTTADDRLVTSKYFTNQLQADESNLYGNGHNYIDGQGNTIPAGTVDCETAAADPYHNAWWQMYGGLQAGHVYRLMVTTTDPSNQTGNLSQNFENMFSIAVSGSGNTIAGNGSMETYANISSGSQQFYLAQIDAQAGAGKTVEIDLFDPGDTSSASWIQIEPDTSSAATAWQPATFAYTSTGSTSPWPSSTSTNCIQTHGGTGTAPSGCTQTSSNSSTFFQDSWVAITISLPTTYGSTPLVNSGWWKIKYIVNLGNDTTTWQVSIRGNPVHLI
jgi:Flp pilus assembly protein TadG